MLTIPSSIFKSYTKDLSLPIFELVSVSKPCYDLGPKAMSTLVT
jgi:hypothetical protein